MTTYKKETTIDTLTAEQLELMARSDHRFVVSFLEDGSVFDAHRIRLLLELGSIEANKRLQSIQSDTAQQKDKGGETA